MHQNIYPYGVSENIIWQSHLVVYQIDMGGHYIHGPLFGCAHLGAHARLPTATRILELLQS